MCASSSNSSSPSRRGLAKALEAAEDRFNVLFRESSDCIMLLDPQGALRMVNVGMQHYTGIELQEAQEIRAILLECVHAVERESVKCAIAQCAAGERADLVELRLRAGDGSFEWFELSLSPLQQEDHGGRGMLGVARNIHRRKELEDRLRHQAATMQQRHQSAQLLLSKLKHFFSHTANLSPDLDAFFSEFVRTLDSMYRPGLLCVQIFEGNRRYWGGRQAAAPHPEDLPVSTNKVLLDSGLPLYCNMLNLTIPYREDPLIQRMRWQTFLGAPLRDAQGEISGLLSIFDDRQRHFDDVDVELITVAALHMASRLRTEVQEKMNRELSDHLRQAQKMEAVGVLAGGIAHDFNNILGGILGFASHLLTKVDPDTSVHKELRLIEQSAVRAADLTRQLLTFARRKNLEKRPVDIHAVIHEVVALVSRSVDQRITVDWQPGETPSVVSGDAGQLHQVFMNLSLNAAEAMQDQAAGRLTIRVTQGPCTSHEATLPGMKTGQSYVRVIFQDNGPGLSPEVKEHLFEPFYTTKTKSGGTGLGLSIVYGIVSNHGGHIRVDDAPCGGTCFTVYLPLHPMPAHGKVEEGDTPAAQETVRGGGETILVVDDEPIVRHMAAGILRDNGYHVLEAASGCEAVGHIESAGRTVDLVLLDMIMPGMDGEMTFAAIRAKRPNAAVLLTSGYACEEVCARLIRSGARGLLHKPYRSEELLRHVRKAFVSCLQ